MSRSTPTLDQTRPDQYVYADPGYGVEGQTIYNLTEHLAKRLDENGAWQTVGGGGGTPAGSAGEIQFNDGAGGFGASDWFTRNLVTGEINLYAEGTHSFSAYLKAPSDGTGLIAINITVDDGGYAIDAFQSLNIDTPVISGSVVSHTALNIVDQVGATNNFAIKTGLGRVVLGDNGADQPGRILFPDANGAIGGSADFSRDLTTRRITAAISNTAPSVGYLEATTLYVEYTDTVAGQTGADVYTLIAKGTLAGSGEYKTGNDGLTAGAFYALTQDTIQAAYVIGVQSYVSVGDYTTVDKVVGAALTVVGGDGSAVIDIAGADINVTPGTFGTINAYGVRVADVTRATNNYAFKSGAGMVEVGDVGKVAGIHVQGAGAFDVDGGGDKTLLWLDTDTETPYNLVLTNRIAGIAHFAGLIAFDNGDFAIEVDSGASLLRYVAASTQWRLDKSIQFSSWISTLRNTAPADGDIEANEAAMWFDPTNGAAKVMFKGKSADGTVLTGEVPLS